MTIRRYLWSGHQKCKKNSLIQIFLDPICTLYTLTEIMLFASKLATENLFGDEIVVSIGVT